MSRRDARAYERHRDRTGARGRRQAQAGREIGPIPPIADPRRRSRAAADFQRFCLTYFAPLFFMPFCPDHKTVIKKIQTAVVRGGLFAVAMPRGSGKTTLCEIAVLWALITGRREFVCLIGADERIAVSNLDSIKKELQENEDLAADFPEVCFPIQAMDNVAQRATGQLYHGHPVGLQWTTGKIVLPNIPGSQAAGSIVRAAGLTSGIRGMSHKLPDGSKIRPSLVIVDDPQTDESARSLAQCATREAILTGAVLGLAGPSRRIAGIMPCTVINPGDLADRILDRTKFPEWQGERLKLIYAMPTNTKKWDEYREIRDADLAADGDGGLATKFYRKHRRAMDRGARPAWKQRYNRPSEISAVQHAMNLFFRNARAFASEYQNEPLDLQQGTGQKLTADDVAARFNGRPRGEVPHRCQVVTSFVDIHDDVLYWLAAAWEPEFAAAYVLDYGTHPQQPADYFTLDTAPVTLGHAHPGTAKEGAIYAGLVHLLGILTSRLYRRDDGAELPAALTLVDTGYKQDIAAQVIRQMARGPALRPSRGFGIRAGNKPYSEYKPEAGITRGQNWRIGQSPGMQLLCVNIDTNWWKSWLADRWTTPPGDRGALTLFGKRADEHRLFADHQVAEYRERTFGRGRWVDEWRQKPGNPDNHWFDCSVGCAVAASAAGLAMPEWTQAEPTAVTGPWFSKQKRRPHR